MSIKRAVLLHGTDGSPEGNWFPWLKKDLESRDYEVWAPDLPNNHTPNREIYNDFLFGKGWDFTDNLIFGHSSGAVSILNLLMDSRTPKIKAGVFIGAWSHMEETDLDREQFIDLFPVGGFNFDLIKKNADELIFFHGDNDPYCPLEQAKWLAEKTDSDIVIIPNGGHLGKQFSEFPQVLDELNQRKLL